MARQKMGENEGLRPLSHPSKAVDLNHWPDDNGNQEGNA